VSDSRELTDHEREVRREIALLAATLRKRRDHARAALRYPQLPVPGSEYRYYGCSKAVRVARDGTLTRHRTQAGGGEHCGG
jgi:hypothetical protein